MDNNVPLSHSMYLVHRLHYQLKIGQHCPAVTRDVTGTSSQLSIYQNGERERAGRERERKSGEGERERALREREKERALRERERE
jgi:hypothetical protein